MSIKSQESNMRKLAALLANDLSYIWGEKESGPNGDKKKFLNTGRTFLRALAKDLGLHDAVVSANPGGIAVSGEVTLMGMWDGGGLYVCLSQFSGGKDVLYYRTIRHMKDYSGGYNHWLNRKDLETMSYERFCCIMSSFRRKVVRYGLAA